ncbi:MAG: tetratricopeptide repeat protein [Acidobacteriota bacterium]
MTSLIRGAFGFALLVWVAGSSAAAVSASDDASALVARALRAREAHDDVAAIRILEEAVALEPRPEWLGLLAETLAWEKEFARSESLYRRALAAAPSSRDIALGLGRVLLWEGRYPEAHDLLATLVARGPRDADALEALALGEYWSGDYRSAARDFRRVLLLRPDSPQSKKSLDEIAGASQSTWAFGAEGLTDDQPYRTLRLEARASVFSDPLTRWDVSAGTYALKAPDAAPERGDAPWGRAGLETVVPSIRLTVTGWLEALRAPDGTTLGLWGLSLRRSLGPGGALTLTADRREALATRSAIADHPNVTRAGLAWSRESRSGWSAGAEAFCLRWFDGNDGVSAAAWVLVPLVSGSIRLSAGPAFSYRDTNSTRFALASTSSTALDGGGFRYAYTGEYVPYWTPLELWDGRLAAVLEGNVLPRLTGRLRADAGWAHDQAVGFGPDTGTASAPAATYFFTYGRVFHPWRVAASLAWDLGAGARIEVGYEHQTTVYYRSDALHASVVGRF